MLGKLFGKKEPKQAGGPKPSKPKEILQPIGLSLVVKHHEDPDWVWKLLCVVQPDPEHAGRELFRVFDNQACLARGVAVKGYADLDSHPELVAYLGWIDKKTKEMELIDPRESRREAV